MARQINRRHALLTLAGACTTAMLPLPQASKAAPAGDVVTGRIKWFNNRCRYGFIVPDDGGSEPLLLAETLRAYGVQDACEGARIRAGFEQRRKGRLITAVHYLERIWPTPRDQGPASADTDWAPAFTKWYNRVRGFGFLTQGDGTPDIFVHAGALRQNGFDGLRPGQAVLVRCHRMVRGGLIAVNLRPATHLERYLLSVSTRSPQISNCRFAHLLS